VTRPRSALPRWVAIAAISGAGVFAAADAILEHGAGVPWYLSIPDALVGWAYVTGGVVAFRAAYVTGGVVAFRARRLDRTGTLMTSIGVIWNLSAVALYVHALLPYAGWLGNLVDPLLAQLLLSYPSRAVRSRLERAVLAAAYVQVLVVNGAREVFVNVHDYYPCPCVNSFPTVHNPAVFRALETELRIAVVVIGGAVLALVFRRWQRSSGPARRALNPLWFAGLATLTALILDDVLSFASLTFSQSNADTAVVTLIRLIVPVALLIGLVRIWQSRSAVADLVLALDRAPGPAGVRQALASALGDPSLTVCYWEPDTRSFVDADGRPADPEPPPGRAATEVTADGAPLAVLGHDAELLDQRPLLDAVVAAARLALANARLQAALAAQLEEVRASRARIVQAGLAERRKVERDLHDGAQQRLLALSLTIAMINDKLAAGPDPDAELRRLADTARGEIGAAIGELRELGRGLHPAVLTNEGLAAAVETLAALAPLPVTTDITPARYAPTVEATAYFVISEALANVARHARASKAEVTACRDGTELVVQVRDDGIGGAPARGGSGLTGLADRVAALGGRLTITSPADGGTTIRADLPCA
jgi:signal transduction histidine kinase